MQFAAQQLAEQAAKMTGNFGDASTIGTATWEMIGLIAN